MYFLKDKKSSPHSSSAQGPQEISAAPTSSLQREDPTYVPNSPSTFTKSPSSKTPFTPRSHQDSAAGSVWQADNGRGIYNGPYSFDCGPDTPKIVGLVDGTTLRGAGVDAVFSFKKLCLAQPYFDAIYDMFSEPCSRIHDCFNLTLFAADGVDRMQPYLEVVMTSRSSLEKAHLDGYYVNAPIHTYCIGHFS